MSTPGLLQNSGTGSLAWVCMQTQSSKLQKAAPKRFTGGSHHHCVRRFLIAATALPAKAAVSATCGCTSVNISSFSGTVTSGVARCGLPCCGLLTSISERSQLGGVTSGEARPSPRCRSLLLIHRGRSRLGGIGVSNLRGPLRSASNPSCVMPYGRWGGLSCMFSPVS